MKQTAVEYLMDKLLIYDCLSVPKDFWYEYLQLIQQAKEIEKEQIMQTARQCHFEGVRQSAKTSQEYIDYSEQYYNKTYGK
jgi:hypothetical protein